MSIVLRIVAKRIDTIIHKLVSITLTLKIILKQKL